MHEKGVKSLSDAHNSTCGCPHQSVLVSRGADTALSPSQPPARYPRVLLVCSSCAPRVLLVCFGRISALPPDREPSLARSNRPCPALRTRGGSRSITPWRSQYLVVVARCAWQPGAHLDTTTGLSLRDAADRGRDEGLTSPLPPNRTGGFPASGFPVSGVSARCVPLLARTRIPARHAVPAKSIALGGAPSAA